MKMRILAFAVLFFLGACSAPKPSANALHVTLVADGTRKPVAVESSTASVRDVLQQANVTLNDLDRVRPPESVAISDGMTITITRVLQRTETQTQTLPFTQQTVRDATLPAGQTRVIQPGRNGALQLTYRLTFEDGAQTERVEVRRQVIEQPVPEMVLVGIANAFSSTPFTGTIAYIANNNAYVIRKSTSNRGLMTASGDLDGRVFALSPDGAWLLYTRALTRTVEDGPLNSLWAVNTTRASAAPRLLKTPGVIWAGWSPRGDAIAYSTATATSGQPGWRAANDLWLAGFREGEISTPEKILEPSIGGAFGWWGANYEWSPDGKSVAIGSTENVSVIHLDKRKRIVLASFVAYDSLSNWAWTPSVAWTSDSKFVVTVIHGPPTAGEAPEISQVFHVWAFAIDSSVKARLTRPSGMWATPRVGAGQIVFGIAEEAPFASARGRYYLFRMDRDGSNMTRLFPPEGRPGLQERPDFAFSSDGMQIVVAYQGDLYLVNVMTGASQQLTTEGNISSPRWAR